MKNHHKSRIPKTVGGASFDARKSDRGVPAVFSFDTKTIRLSFLFGRGYFICLQCGSFGFAS